MRDLGVVLFFLGILGIVGIPGFAALLLLPGARPAYTLAWHTRSQADEAPP